MILLLVWTLVLGAAAASDDPPCELVMSNDITDNITEKFRNGSILAADGLLYGRGDYFYHLGRMRGCPCRVKRCVRRCCQPGFLWFDSGCLKDDENQQFAPLVTNATAKDVTPENAGNSSLVEEGFFAYLRGDSCQSVTKYALEDDPLDEYHLLKDGMLYMPHAVDKILDHQTFCMENNANGTISVIVCFEDESQHSLLLTIGMFISIPFLFATLLVYACVPELQNLHGKSLMGYISGLLLAYIFLVISQLAAHGVHFSENYCEISPFLIYFFFMISFFWLNVMCIDIWWTFRGMRARSGRRTAEKRRFILYCIYAWGMPLVMTGILALLHFHPNLPEHVVRPGFGNEKCWFDTDSSQMYYFYIPISILICANISLFIITTVKILRINRETAMLSNSDSGRHSQIESDKQRFFLYLKLFSVMGINWIAELISFYIGGAPWYWIVTDLCNSLVGIMIFMLFVWKKKVKKLLIKRYTHVRYGSTASKSRSSSRIRSGNATFSTTGSDLNTEKSFISMENRPLRTS